MDVAKGNEAPTDVIEADIVLNVLPSDKHLLGALRLVTGPDFIALRRKLEGEAAVGSHSGDR